MTTPKWYASACQALLADNLTRDPRYPVPTHRSPVHPTGPPQAFTSKRDADFIPVEFLIVGASVAGLSSAIALRRAGHKVTVFDMTSPFEPVRPLALLRTQLNPRR